MKKPHWYYTYVHACFECGHETVYRERRYGPKPEDPNERRSMVREHCGCISGGFA